MLNYPHMREELLSHLWDLADRQRLLENSGEASLLDYAVHFLFDDTPLGEDPSRAVGWCLHNEAEARLIGTVASALDRVFEKHGIEQGDAFYVSCQEWAAVQAAAANAHLHLKGSTSSR